MLPTGKIGKPKSLLGNLVRFSLSTLTTFLLFLLFIIAGRFLGPEDFGRFSFALALALIFEPLLDPGLYHFLIKEIARKKDWVEQYLSHTLSWKLIAAPATFCLVVVSANLLHDYPATLHAAYLMAVGAILKSVKDGFRSTLLSHEYFGLDAISLLCERISLLILGTWVLFRGYGLMGLCWVFVLVRFFDLLIMMAIVRRNVCKVSLKLDPIFLKTMLISALPIGAYYITLNIYNYIDTVMLSVLRTDQEVGWYNASYKLYEGLMIVPVIVGTVFIPRLSQAYYKNQASLNPLITRGLKYIGFVSLLVAGNGYFLTHMLISFIYGIEYVQATRSLSVLLLGVIFAFTLNFLQAVLISVDKQVLLLRVAIGGLLCNVALNLILIPQYGYVGAALATVMVEAVLAIFFIFYVKHFVLAFHWWEVFGKSIMAWGISLFIATWLIPGDMNALIKCLVMSVGFVAFSVGFGFFRNEEWVMKLKNTLFGYH